MQDYYYGDFAILRRGRILEIFVGGEWNQQMATAFAERFFELVSELDGQEFATLVHVAEFVLGTPEFQQVIAAGAQQAVEAGMRREAYVIFGGGIKLAQFSAMTPVTGEYQRRYFVSYIDAISWLQNEGYALEAQPGMD